MIEPRPPGETATTPVRHPGDGWVMADPVPMRSSTLRAFRGLIRAFCPAPGEPVEADLTPRVELHVRRILAYMPAMTVLGFKLAIHLLDWSPLWRGAAWRRVQHLDREAAGRVLDGIGASRFPLVRLVMLGVRGSVLSTWFDQDEVHRAMGYAPAPFIASRIALRRRLLEGGRPPGAEDGDVLVAEGGAA